MSLYHLVEDGVVGTPPLVVYAAFHLRGAKQATPLCLGCPLALAEPLRPSSLMVLLFALVAARPPAERTFFSL